MEGNSKTEKVKRYRNYNWTDAEVRALMKAWWDHHKDYMSSKGGCSRRPLYDKISFDIRRYGYQRTRAEAQTKLQNLLKMFRRERELLRQTGEKYSKWRYYNLVKRIVDADPREIDDSVQEYLSSDQDSRENEIETSSTAYIVKLSSSTSGNASDSDNPSSSQLNVDSQDVTEDESLPFNAQTKRRRKHMEDVLGDLLQEIQRANAHNERHEEIISLLRENNELCKQQNELLTLLLNK